MAAEVISDVVVPEVYNDYFYENSIYKSAVYKSGIVIRNPILDANLQAGAETFNLPFWKTDDIVGGSATPVDEGSSLTPGNIGSGKMIARRHFREKAWGKNDVAIVLAGDDPFTNLLTLTEAFWNKNYQAMLFSSVQGVIADNIANDRGDMVNDIQAVGDGKISSDAVIDTAMLYGDQGATVTTAIAMHSVVYGNLLKLNLIDNRPDNEQNIGWGVYLGKTVIVDDTLVVGSTYWTLMFKGGAFAYGESSKGYLPTEVDRDPAKSGGQELYYTRRVFAIHPFGFAWSDDATPDADFPTDSELILAANWDRVVSSVKNTGFVAIKSLG